jgi:membrane associated rhomboid family serine protease
MAAQDPSTSVPDQFSDDSEGDFRVPWVTGTLCGICFLVFLTLVSNPAKISLPSWAFEPSVSIWGGKYWAIFSCAFVHREVWHLVFNVYWLWILGKAIEFEIGRWRWLCFVVLSIPICSVAELAFANTTGVGASGFICAAFGFMWISRKCYPSFSSIINKSNVVVFIGWLGLCLLLTYFKIWNVPNVAHGAGLLFGISVAMVFCVKRYRPLFVLFAMAMICMVPVLLVWCPWSIGWMENKAYKLSLGKNPNEALLWCSRAIKNGDEDSWIFFQRATLFMEKRLYRESVSDLEMCLKKTPEFSAAKNSLAWVLATAPIDSLRNGSRAVLLAKEACEEMEMDDAAFLDTLAAAYAETGDFEKAISNQEDAVKKSDPQARKDYQDHLECFRAHKPWREPAATGVETAPAPSS